MQCEKVNMDNYRCYLTARIWIFKSSGQDLARETFFTLRVHHPVSMMETRWLHILWRCLWWWCHLHFLYLLGLWAWLRRSRFIFHNFFRFFIFFPFILWRLILLALGWSTSPPRGLLRLFISGITIEITMYLFSRELEVNLSWSNVDDRRW